MTPSSGIRPDRTAVWIYLFLLFVHMTVIRGHFVVTDEVIYYETTRSIAERGRLDIPSAGLAATYQGRGGLSYGFPSKGLSVAAVPLYLLGRAVDRYCVSHNLYSWTTTFGTVVIGSRSGWVWGGTTDIFFVGLFNPFIIAALGALFYRFERHLGCSPRWAAIGALATGLTSEIAGLSTSFYEHPLEALFLLATLYELVVERDRPGTGRRLYAGSLAGLLILMRLQAAVALPALTLYLAFNAARRSAAPGIARRLRAVIRPAIEFVTPIAAAVFCNCWIHFIESGAWSLLGGYGSRPSPFTGPLYRGLFGYLLSPGQSIFLFTPLLFLLRPTFRQFWRHFRAETAVIAAIFASYVLVFADLDFWHGLWCYGPRYLAATMPLLLLPLPLWLESGGARRRVPAALLGLAGLWMQATSLLVNFSFIFYEQHYMDSKPLDAFLFDPATSPVLAHSRALLSWNGCVDFWLRDVREHVGTARMWQVFLPLAVGVIVSALGLTRSLGRRQNSYGP